MKAHVADWQTRVYCVRIVPEGAPPVRIAGYPIPLIMGNGAEYLTENGYEFSGLGSESGLAAASVDLEGILSAGAISRADLTSGVYDNARVYLFATSWAAPIEDEEPLSLMFWGKTTITDDNSYKAELMGLIDLLSQETARTYGNMCDYTFLDRSLDGTVLRSFRSRCTGPRAAPDGPVFENLLVTGTATAVASQYVFTDAARTEPDDYFGNGAIRFLTGLNAGLKPLEIKSYAAGVIEVHEAFSYLAQVGDQYEMLPGCRKRLTEDCAGKWGNGKNFGGFDDVPTPSQYTQVGRN